MDPDDRKSIDDFGARQELPDLPAGYQYSRQAVRGLPPHAVPVASLLTSLSRCARSLGFYSPNNRALRVFFDKLSGEMTQYLDRKGVLALHVDPTRFLFADEVVFEDADRERSLPFRLYRDGVRTLTFKQGVSREELLKLSQILGARATGLQLHGEDIVTRLWKAELPSIEYEVVKGFVRQSLQSEERPDAGGGVPAIMRRIHGVLAFEGLDPATSVEIYVAEDDEEAPRWHGGVYPGGVHHEPIEEPGPDEIWFPRIDPDQRAALRAELDAENDSILTQFLDFLLDLSITQGEILRPEHFLDLVFDGWRKLVAEGNLADLTALVEYLTDLATSGEHGGETQVVAQRMLKRFLTHDSLRRVVAATPAEGDGPAQLEGYLRALGYAVDKEVALQLLRYDMPASLRETLTAYLAWLTQPDPRWLGGRLRTAEPLDLLTIMETVAQHGDDEGRQALLGLIRHEMLDLRLHLLALMAQMPYSDGVRRALGRAVGDSSEQVRSLALEQIARHRDPASAGPLTAEAERLGIVRWTPQQREPFLRALAASDPLRAVTWVQKHIPAGGRWGRLNPEKAAWADLALEALVIIGDFAALEVLRQLKDAGPDEYRKRALRAFLDVDRRLRRARETHDGEDGR